MWLWKWISKKDPGKKQTDMKCKKCLEKLEILRGCWKVRLRCTGCGHEYYIHEVATELDEETEKKLEQYSAIIYD